MSARVKPIPDGYHTATPYLIITNAAQAIDFYKEAFGATELGRLATPDGKVGHGAEIKSRLRRDGDAFRGVGVQPRPRRRNGSGCQWQRVELRRHSGVQKPG